MVKVTPIPAFTDNYIWCLHDENHAVVVDPGDAAPVQKFLSDNNLRLDTILITHHHWDHIGGVKHLLGDSVNVVGPVTERIPNITAPKTDGDQVTIPALGLTFTVFDVPGHTLDHIAYVGEMGLFCGDTMFSAGCGRLFEGTPAQMLAAFERFKALPDSTKVYCTHEYTEANVTFALELTPDNVALKQYQTWVLETRSKGLPTLPSSIKLEKNINPYMRVSEAELQAAIIRKAGTNPNNDIETFAAVRTLKDNF